MALRTRSNLIRKQAIQFDIVEGIYFNSVKDKLYSPSIPDIERLYDLRAFLMRRLSRCLLSK